MMFTEEEAKTKWCPAMGAVNSAIKQEIDCVASRCMAWRWVEGQWEYAPGSVDRPKGDGWERLYLSPLPNWRRPKVNRLGYCGLGGRPEE